MLETHLEGDMPENDDGSSSRREFAIVICIAAVVICFVAAVDTGPKPLTLVWLACAAVAGGGAFWLVRKQDR